MKLFRLYLGAAKCIISTAQQARPNVIGHKEPFKKKQKVTFKYCLIHDLHNVLVSVMTRYIYIELHQKYWMKTLSNKYLPWLNWSETKAKSTRPNFNDNVNSSLSRKYGMNMPKRGSRNYHNSHPKNMFLWKKN